MSRLLGFHRAKFCAICLGILLLCFCVLSPQRIAAQVATAAINGEVKDSSGSAIPAALVTMTNVATNVRQITRTNGVGAYVFLNIIPGKYNLAVSKQGFQTQAQNGIVLEVNQTTTFDFTLPVGSSMQTIVVKASAASLQTSTAELGTVVSQTEVNDLPLNGRNFTQLLALTPGVSTVNTSQNSGGFNTNPTGIFVVPAVNGQTNRSDFFMLDGLNDQEVFSSTYTIAPIVDDIQEFKVVSHTDDVQFGGAIGGMINAVTKGGTNHVHGAAWEYLRNNAFDARTPFQAETSPLHQNQFGGNIGGPVVLPHYNGRNRTFFFGSYEGFRNHTSSTSLETLPTQQELNGDFSDLKNAQGQLIQLYNPFSTVPDPNNPGELLRQPFNNNQIPVTQFDPNMLKLAKMVYPAAAYNTGIPGINYIFQSEAVQDTDLYNIRGDEQLGDKDSFWARFSHLRAPVTSNNGDLPDFEGVNQYHAHLFDASWNHTFGPTANLQVQFGRNWGYSTALGTSSTLDANALTQAGGFSSIFACNFPSGAPQTCFPGIGLSGFTGFGESFNGSNLSNDWEWKANLSLIRGTHTLYMGADINYNTFQSPIYYSGACFSSFQTSNLETSTGGSSVASFLLGVPDSASRRNVLETENDGYVNGFYFQDQWKATDRLTLNMGLRYDYTLVPWYGQKSDGSWSDGNLNLNDGTYELEHSAPACSTTQQAPCIPGGTLPAHVYVSPNGKIIHSTFDNIQPRLGLAYRLGSKTVLRASGGRFFDNWAGVFQMAQNFEGAWPGIGQFLAQNLNQGLPNVPAENPFLLTSGAYPGPTPFTQVQWFMNPLIQNPESWQWTFGIQRQLSPNTVMTVNYAGSADTRTDIGGNDNVAVTPGPGDPQSRAPYPYIAPTFYDRSTGRATYNSLQFTLNRTWSSGLSFLVSYTWEKTEDLGSDGWFGADGESVQNPYNLKPDWSVAGYDVPNTLTASWTYALPFGSGKRFQSGSKALDYVVGNWQINGIATFTSGYPYTINAPTGIPNTGTSSERGDQIANNASLASPTLTEWFNTAAFAPPAPYTFGSAGRDSLRTDWTRNLDLSIFRDFPISETKKFEFRAEAFNATNIPIWGFPDSGVTDQNFGVVTSTLNSSREIQFALKFYF